MTVDFIAPEVKTPYRVIFLGASTQGWYEASDEDRREKILPRFKAAITQWRAMGARVLATVDDDLFMVGPPHSTDFTWYLVFEIPSLETAAAMIQTFRVSENGVRLDRYFRLEARFGRPFFLLEDG